MDNVDVARRFDEIADLLEIQGENPFRIRAYRGAARTIATLGTPIVDMVRENPDALDALPGFGADLASKAVTLARTGTLPLLKELTRKTPKGLVALLRVPGLGPKRAQLLHATLGITSLAGLERAAKAGQLAQIRGFGPKTAQAILRGIEQARKHGERTLLADAEAHARPLVEALRAVRGVTQVEVAGSLRRRAETIGDLDVLVASAAPASAAMCFTTHKDVRRVLASGDTRCSVVLKSGMQADLRIVPAASFGAAWHYFTGSKAHNIAVRTMGVKRGLKINEYGVFRGSRRIAGRSEAEIYRTVGLPWIAPELREDRGELDAARAGRLPELVELGDLRGDLQMHTTATDGANTLREMVEACEQRRYEYIAITDHTQAVRVAGGLTRAGFRKQFKEIDALQKSLKRLTLLKSAEVDILDDGTLDLDDGTLRELDLVVVSIHSRFGLSKAEMTRRVVRALAHPRVHVFGHPTGRLINKRDPIALDMTAVIKAARDHGVMLEINGQPDRLDLSDVHIAMAREAGVRLVVSSDAHRTQELDYVRFGIDQARRGWCAAKDIANTRPLAQFRKLLR